MWSSGAIALMWIRRASSGVRGQCARRSGDLRSGSRASGSIHQLRDVARWSRARPRSAWPSSPRSPRGGDDRSEVRLLAREIAARSSASADDPRLAAVLERPDIDRLRLGERLSDHVRAAELVRDGRGAKEPRATRAAVRAQRGRPLERRNRDRECAAPDRTFGRVVEERGGRLIGPVGRGRAMPGRPIEVATTPPVPCGHARRSSTVARCWIADLMSGWRKRSTGPSTSMSRASTAGVDRRRRYAGGSHHLRHPVAIVERSDQQEPLRVRRQIIRARRECTLEARAEREDVAEPVARRVVLADRRRKLGECERTPGRLPTIRSRTDGADRAPGPTPCPARRDRSAAGEPVHRCRPPRTAMTRPREALPASRSDRSRDGGQRTRAHRRMGGRATGRRRRRPGSARRRPRRRAA